MKIKPSDVIGFTQSPDGKFYLNLRGFRQVEVTESAWNQMRKGKLQ